MMESMGTPNQLSCEAAELLLEKRVVEEDFTNTEESLLTSHLASCEQCRDISMITSQLHVFANSPSAAEVDHAVETLLQQLTFDDQTRMPSRFTSRRRWVYLAAAGLILALLTVLGVRLFTGGSSAGAGMDCTPGATQVLADGVVMRECQGTAREIRVDAAGQVLVTLREGAVAFSVDPARRHRQPVRVTTPLAAVEVKGTVLGVYVHGDDSGVEVYRGTVGVTPAAFGQPAYDVTAGQGMAFGQRTAYALEMSRTRRISSGFVTSPEASGNSGRRSSDVAGNDGKSKPAVSEPMGSVKGNVSPEPRADGDAGHIDGRSGRWNRDSVQSMDSLLRGAQQCLIDRDWQGAAERYRHILKRYPNTPGATTVLVSLARIELRYLGAPRAALRHYQLYQKKLPNGPLAEEALYGITEAYHRLGENSLETATLRQFVSRYPGSALSPRANARLSRLSAAETVSPQAQ
ncbi:MAG: FecR domain-containing protein [Deltaproteobacteria bacterium]|nr:FecR domain-containing protein [Deltaproteobacteria bacterium]